MKNRYMLRWVFLVAFGSRTLDVTLSFGMTEKTKLSIARVVFGVDLGNTKLDVMLFLGSINHKR